MNSFPPIGEYAFLSDCENNCLVAPDGSIEWLCLPRPDSPSIFGALLDRTAGSFRLGPANVNVPHHRRYIPGTMVLETTWHTPTGWLLVTDFMAVRPVSGAERRRPDYRRAPGDAAACGTLGARGHVYRGEGRGLRQLRAQLRVWLQDRTVAIRRRRIHDGGGRAAGG